MKTEFAELQRKVDLNSLEWNDLRLILAIGRTGSLTGAARELKNDHSTVFRKLGAIEKRVGVRFFDRLKGRYKITEAGDAALRLAMSFESDILGLERELVGQDARLRGNIRISAVEGPAVIFLPKLLAGFRRLHPEVTFDLLSEFGASDLSRREADIAVRVTKSPPDSYLGRNICDFKFAAYASPTYLERSGSRPLADHDWVVFEPMTQLLIPQIFSSDDVRKNRTVLSTNSVQSAVAAVQQGLGALAISSCLVDSDPNLIRIAGPFEELTMQLWVLMHPDLRNTARVTALMHYIARELRQERALFEGSRVPG